MLQHLAAACFVVIAYTAAAACFVAYVWQRFFSRQGLPESLPWAGAGKGVLSRATATRKSFFGLREIIQDGYDRYSKRNQAFVLPNLVSGAEVIIPMSQMRWLLEQPDHILSQRDLNREFLHADRTMLHSNVIRDGVHSRVIRKELTKDLDNYATAIVKEVEHSLRLNWGVSHQDWTEVSVYDTMLDVVSRISNRVLVGLPLCRNREYLQSTSTFARNVVITAGLLNLLPEALRPVLGPLIMAYDMSHHRQIAKHISPIVKERMADFKPGLDYKKPDYSKHDDYIQWALHDAFSHDDPTDQTPEMITRRLTVLSFAAIQSSVITITNALFDIASSPRSREFQQAMREEVQNVTLRKPESDRWRRANLALMVRIDSALKESMRLWGFISRGVMKKVVTKEGLTLPSGEHLPYGAKVGVTAYAIHHDESVYHHAFEYDAFRFCRETKNGDKDCSTHSLVTSSDRFMAFSHGRHACPGRFFAANQLKILLAQIVQNYDIEPIPERPPNPWLNNSIGPPIWSKLRVRRRPACAEPCTPGAASVPAPRPMGITTDLSEHVPLAHVPPRTTRVGAFKEPSSGTSFFDTRVLPKFAAARELPAPIIVEG